MKRYFFYAVTIVIALVFTSCSGSYVVRERPANVVYTRPGSPGSNYVWISGDWVWKGGRYIWREGRWERRRDSRRWIEGYWERSRGGWKWRPGHYERY